MDGKPVQAERKSYILLNKPRGFVATLADPEGRPTVMELLPKDGPRIYPVGRLDFNTEGLLVFTNDGDLANGLMHPRRQVNKTYHAKLRAIITDEEVKQLEAGIELDGAVRKATVVGGGLSTSGKYSWVELMITEGRNRQVHRMLEALGHEVARLVRVGYGGLVPDKLRLGKWRPLTLEEVQALGELAGVRKPVVTKKPMVGKQGRSAAAFREEVRDARKPTSRGAGSRPQQAPPKGPPKGGPKAKYGGARNGTNRSTDRQPKRASQRPAPRPKRY